MECLGGVERILLEDDLWGCQMELLMRIPSEQLMVEYQDWLVVG
jgi:hypothetical protein